jgi:hypothetical protein
MSLTRRRSSAGSTTGGRHHGRRPRQEDEVKVGDRVTLRGNHLPGRLDLQRLGIYKATRRSLDRSQFFFHWDYLNES